MPCAKLIVDSNPTADFCYLHFFSFFFCTSRPLGLPGGTYDTCPAMTYVPLHLVPFYALCGWEAPYGSPRDISLPALGQMGCPKTTDIWTSKLRPIWTSRVAEKVWLPGDAKIRSKISLELNHPKMGTKTQTNQSFKQVGNTNEYPVWSEV